MWQLCGGSGHNRKNGIYAGVDMIPPKQKGIEPSALGVFLWQDITVYFISENLQKK